MSLPQCLGLSSLVCMCARSAFALADPPCVLQYDFEEATGPTGQLLDSSGYLEPLPLTKYASQGASGVEYHADTPVSGDGYVFGGSSLRFGSQFSMAYVTPGSLLKHELQSITVEAWVKVAASVTSTGVIINDVPTHAWCLGRGWSLGVAPGGAFWSVGDQTDGVVLATAAGPPLQAGRWYHLAGSYDASSQVSRLFIDGREVANKVGNGSIDYSNAPGSTVCIGPGGPNPKTLYLGVSHPNFASGPTADLAVPMPEGALVDRVRVLAVAAAPADGIGSLSPDLDYLHCKIVIVQPPATTSACNGGNVTVTVAAAGDIDSYRWQYREAQGWVPLSDGTRASGAHVAGSASSILDITGATIAEAGEYRCVLSNASGSVESDAATLTICPSDYNCDTFVNGDDFDAFTIDFELGLPAADINHDTFVTGDDFDFFMDHFASGC